MLQPEINHGDRICNIYFYHTIHLFKKNLLHIVLVGIDGTKQTNNEKQKTQNKQTTKTNQNNKSKTIQSWN